MEDSKKVKIYGLKRSGTNYLTLLLRRNYKVEALVNKGGWKHGLYRCRELLGKALNAIVIVKHPLPWLVSMYRYQKAFTHFGNFIKKEDAIIAWNSHGAYWQTMEPADFKIVFVRYEDLVQHPEKECEKIAQELDFEKKGNFRNVRNRVKPGEKISTKKFDRFFYTAHRYLKGYKPDLVRFVAERIDPYVLDGYGYERITYEQE